MWQKLKAYAWALAGNSKTLLVAYGMEVIGFLDEAKYFDWSSLVGSERAGRIVAICGGLMIVMRVLTKGAMAFEVLHPTPKENA